LIETVLVYQDPVMNILVILVYLQSI